MAIQSKRAGEISAFIEQHQACIKGKQKVEINGKIEFLDSYMLPLQLLQYNHENGRFNLEIQEYEAQINRKLDPTDKADINKLKELLLQDVIEAEKLFSDLEQVGEQREFAAITHDGIVVNGNRRMATIEKLHIKYPAKWSELWVVRLPEGISEKDLWKIEAGLQLSKEKVADYGPVNNLLMIREGKKAGLNHSEIAASMYSIWHTGELHILFGDTGTGKSILATQFCNAISKGESVFKVLPNENGPLKVLFYDFELSDAQFKKRYTSEDGAKDYDFAENLHIDNVNRKSFMVDSTKKMDESIIAHIKRDLELIKPDVLVIDNITYLATESTQETNVASQLMVALNDLKNEYKLSILVLAHTPKMKVGTPLTLNELGGSKMLSNFADSVSALGKSTKDSNFRYIIQTKCRSEENAFNHSSVIVLELKKEETFLGFNYIDCQYESEHLKSISDEAKEKEREEQKAQVLQLHQEGKSTREIEEITGISKSKVIEGLYMLSLITYKIYSNNGN